MTLHQLEYIIAIDRHRNFAKAAAELGITQPTLSSLLQKLENELDVRIFERSNKHVRPTAIGQKILLQAAKTVTEADRIAELVAEEKGMVAGTLDLSVGPTVAPYILPRFIKTYTRMFPDVRLSIAEMKAEAMLDAVHTGRLDAGIASGGRSHDGILEIPLYTEPFWVYIAESCWRKLPVFRPENLEHEQMWVMKESQCLRDSAFSFCKARGKHRDAGTHRGRKRRVHHNSRNAPAPAHRQAARKRTSHRGRLQVAATHIDLHTRRFRERAPAQQHRGDARFDRPEKFLRRAHTQIRHTAVTSSRRRFGRTVRRSAAARGGPEGQAPGTGNHRLPVAVLLTTQMLTSYSSHIGKATSDSVKTSEVGVIMAATTRMTTTACFR